MASRLYDQRVTNPHHDEYKTPRHWQYHHHLEIMPEIPTSEGWSCHVPSDSSDSSSDRSSDYIYTDIRREGEPPWRKPSSDSESHMTSHSQASQSTPINRDRVIQSTPTSRDQDSRNRAPVTPSTRPTDSVNRPPLPKHVNSSSQQPRGTQHSSGICASGLGTDHMHHSGTSQGMDNIRPEGYRGQLTGNDAQYSSQAHHTSAHISSQRNPKATTHSRNQPANQPTSGRRRQVLPTHDSSQSSWNPRGNRETSSSDRGHQGQASTAGQASGSGSGSGMRHHGSISYNRGHHGGTSSEGQASGTGYGTGTGTRTKKGLTMRQIQELTGTGPFKKHDSDQYESEE